MRLRAAITIDIEAADFVEAATHQRQLQALFDQVAAAYPMAEFHFRERRKRTARRPLEAEPEGAIGIEHYTGKLNRYA